MVTQHPDSQATVSVPGAALRAAAGLLPATGALAHPRQDAHAQMAWWEGLVHRLTAADHLLITVGAVAVLVLVLRGLPPLRAALARRRRGGAGD